MNEFNRIKDLRTNSLEIPDDANIYLEELRNFLAQQGPKLINETGKCSYANFFYFMQDFNKHMATKGLLASLFFKSEKNAELNAKIASQVAIVDAHIKSLRNSAMTHEDIMTALATKYLDAPVSLQEFEVGLAAVEGDLNDLIDQKANYELFSNDYNNQMNILRRGFTALAK